MSIEVGMTLIAGKSILPHCAIKVLGPVPRLRFWEKQLSWPTAAQHEANEIGPVPGLGQVCSKKSQVPSPQLRTT